MSAISIAYLELRLSGGSGNTDPNAALGGDLSSERILSQSHSALSNVTGVVIDYAAGNALGAGVLAFTFATKLLSWTPNGGSVGPTVDITASGQYAIFGSAGFFLITVTSGSLPGSDKTDNVTIANIANEVFDDVAKAESFAGDTEYRCWYVKNTHPTDPFLDVVAFVPTQPSPGTIDIGLDPAGTGDGVTRSATITRSGATATATSTAHGYDDGDSVRIAGAVQTEYNGVQTITVTGADTFTYAVGGTPVSPATGTITAARGVAVTVVDENTAPAGVTFSSPSSEAPDGLSLGQLDPGESAAIWERRIIPTRNTTANAASISFIQLQSYF